jgi:hypothetical protein
MLEDKEMGVELKVIQSVVYTARHKVKDFKSYDRVIWEENLRRNFKVTELREAAKSYGISGCWDMRKEDLIKAILDLEIATEEEKDKMEMQKRTTEDYGKNVEVGTIVAFKHEDRLISGKIIKIVADAGEENNFIIQTIRGTSLVIGRKDVKWYKTGRRWPKFIFEQLRGITNGQEEK